MGREGGSNPPDGINKGFPTIVLGELSGIGETGINSGRRLTAGLVYVGVLIHQVPEAHTRS
jgi:hypothetical protein